MADRRRTAGSSGSRERSRSRSTAAGAPNGPQNPKLPPSSPDCPLLRVQVRGGHTVIGVVTRVLLDDPDGSRHVDDMGG